MPKSLPHCRTAISLLFATALFFGKDAGAQERPGKRLATIVSVAVVEYSKAVGPSGELLSAIELEEAQTFLRDARDVAARLSGERAERTRQLLDSLVLVTEAKALPARVMEVHARFVASLGADAALDMPTKIIDLVEGRTLYAAHCASCHGVSGKGDGEQGRGLDPLPPPIGDAGHMHDVSPALAFNILSVGIAGTSMAGWSQTLTVDQRWNIIAYLNELRAPRIAAPGQGLFLQRCAGCHGATGASDGAFAATLNKLPVELSSFGWQADRSDAQIVRAIRDGIDGTAMPASRELTGAEITQIVAHVRTLALRDVPAVVASGAQDRNAVRLAVMGLLDDALARGRAGQKVEAGDLAFDAYIAFEPIESSARARSPGAVAAMERHFVDFKAGVRASDWRSAENARNAIEAGFPAIVALTEPVSGFWGNFLQSLLIILREGLEAILVIGAVVAFLIKTGHRKRLRDIWIGVGAALVASGVTAVVLSTTLRALPASREIIEGVTMLVAVAVLFSVSYWLISKVEAARWQQFIRERVNEALQHGGGRALVVVAFLAVYREGAETALFYQALLREGAGLPIALGVVVGFAALAVIFTLFYRYGVRIPLRPFFAVTSGLLYYMAFVFMGKGIRELQEGNLISVTALPGWPAIDALGIFPSVETLLAQLLLVVLLAVALLKTFWPKRSVRLPTVEATVSAPVNPPLNARVEALESKVHELESVIDEEAARTPFSAP